MPLIAPTSHSDDDAPTIHYTSLPFPPLQKSHIKHCSFSSWYFKYGSLTPKARLIPLSPAFLSYLRADGIVLPPSSPKPRSLPPEPLTPPPSDAESDDSDWDDDSPDPSEQWPDIHRQITETIRELGGSVYPKLNWSSPKDATWIAVGNSMECRTANDIYLLLKSSDFVTHDLEQVWDGCEDDDSASFTSTEDEAPGDNSSKSIHDSDPTRDVQKQKEELDYVLALRKTIPSLVPSLEFRCFVRDRHLLCLCQRDQNFYDFLPALVPKLRSKIVEFFEEKLRHTFEDPNFVFDVYIPQPYERVWLVDINPWAVRTDPLTFSWLEILTEEGPEMNVEEEVGGDDDEDDEGRQGEEKADEEVYAPEFRLVGRDDPEAYAFNTTKYSAHKLPKDVVDGGQDGGEGLKEFMGQWRDIMQRREADDESDDDDE